MILRGHCRYCMLVPLKQSCSTNKRRRSRVAVRHSGNNPCPAWSRDIRHISSGADENSSHSFRRKQAVAGQYPNGVKGLDHVKGLDQWPSPSHRISIYFSYILRPFNLRCTQSPSKSLKDWAQCLRQLNFKNRLLPTGITISFIRSLGPSPRRKRPGR